MKSSVIPSIVQDEIQKRINLFNKKHLAKASCEYVPEIKGKFIYLMRQEREDLHEQLPEKVCRLTYNGNLEEMDFAIFKYSSEKYDANECFFPGSECVNGTLEGAMKAGLKAYPVEKTVKSKVVKEQQVEKFDINVNPQRIMIEDFIPKEVLGEFEKIDKEKQLSMRRAREMRMDIAKRHTDDSYIQLYALIGSSGDFTEDEYKKHVQEIVRQDPENLIAGFVCARTLLIIGELKQAQLVYQEYVQKLRAAAATRDIYLGEFIDWIYASGLRCILEQNVRGYQTAMMTLIDAHPEHPYVDILSKIWMGVLFQNMTQKLGSMNVVEPKRKPSKKRDIKKQDSAVS
jgi:hypothetical protein